MPKSYSNHLLLVQALNNSVHDIATAQRYINAARQLPVADNWFQLEMDRRQTELDIKKDKVATMLVEIPMSN